jgi:protein tyrosine phosphatase
MNGSDFVEETSAEYFPKNDGLTIRVRNGFNVTLLQTTNVDHVTVRRLQVTNENVTLSSRSRIVMHFQFQSWKMYDQVIPFPIVVINVKLLKVTWFVTLRESARN